MARLTPEHMAMLREIHRRCPVPYEDTFRRNDVCATIEAVKVLLELAEAGMVWFKGYSGELREVGLWAITRNGAETAGRRSPARAGGLVVPEMGEDVAPPWSERKERAR